MPVKPEEILATAEWMIENEPSEVQVRASISSNYYSMYHKVLSILANEPIKYERKGCHASLIQYLQSDAEDYEKHNFNTLKGLAYMLKQEKDLRVIADYCLDHTLEVRNAKDSCSTAKRCFQKCDDLITPILTSKVV